MNIELYRPVCEGPGRKLGRPVSPDTAHGMITVEPEDAGTRLL